MNLFEDYLKEAHAQDYIGCDDDMPDAFENWLTELDTNDLIELGNKAMEEQHLIFREATKRT